MLNVLLSVCLDLWHFIAGRIGFMLQFEGLGWQLWECLSKSVRRWSLGGLKMGMGRRGPRILQASSGHAYQLPVEWDMFSYSNLECWRISAEKLFHQFHHIIISAYLMWFISKRHILKRMDFSATEQMSRYQINQLISEKQGSNWDWFSFRFWYHVYNINFTYFHYSATINPNLSWIPTWIGWYWMYCYNVLPGKPLWILPLDLKGIVYHQS